jgi:abortive infection bacteriophage resistance protein
MSRTFDKVAKTWPEQVAILKDRGMAFDDGDESVFFLQHINYYRLGAYWLPFESDHASHRFRDGVHFKDVLNLYRFDRQLRLLLLDAIERVEVSVRCNWAYQLAHHYGPHAHLNQPIASNKEIWRKNYAKLLCDVAGSKEKFITHHCQAYSEALPAIWVVCEIMTLGQLSSWYKNLGPKDLRSAISSTYGLDETVLESWLHHLTVVRNTCAHHSRLWNREFTIRAARPKAKPRGLADQWAKEPQKSNKLYNTLVILAHFMDAISPSHHWRRDLKELIAHFDIDVKAMGFPSDWELFPIWQDLQP